MKQIWLVLVIGAMICIPSPGLSNAQWVEVNRPGGWRIKDLLVEGPFLFAATNRGVFRSEDDGETWLDASSGLGNSHVTSIVASGTSLLVGTVEGAYRSTDLGSSWTAVNTGLPRPMPMEVRWPAVSVKDEIFVGTDDGVFKSGDGGESWKTVNFGLPGYLYIDGLAEIGSVVFALTSDGVYQTVNRGLEWIRVDLSLSASGSFEAMAQVGEVLFVGTNRKVYVSTDRGASWSKIELGVQTNRFWSFSASDDKLCAHFEGVLFVISKQGERWVAEKSNDLESKCVSDGEISEGPLVDAYRTGFGQSTDKAAFRAVFDRETIEDLLEDLFVIGEHLYADTGDGLFRSIDGGETWKALDADLPRTLSVNAFFKNEAGIFAGTDSGVFLSRNNGRSWTTASPGKIEVFDFVAKGPSLYAGTRDGVYVTQDDGKTWMRTNLVLRRFTDVTSVVVLETAIIAGTDHGAFVSQDDGATWVEIESEQLDDFNWDEMEVIGRDLFLGGYDGVIRSSDLGSTWVDVSEGLPEDKTEGLPEDKSVSDLTVIGDQLFLISSDGRVFTTDDRGATWRATAALPSFGYSGILAAVGDDLLADTSEGIFLSADGGASWTVLGSGSLWQTAKAFSKVGPNLVAGTRDAGIFVHEPGRERWKPSSSGLPRDSNWPGAGFAWAGKYLFVGTIDGVYRSADFGASWGPDTSLKADGPYVRSLTVMGNHILMGASGNVFRWTDDGESWEQMQPELSPWPGIYNLRVVGSTLLADFDKYGTFFLVPGGEEWQRLEDEIESEAPVELDDMTTLAVFGETIFVRKRDRPGMLISTDGGTKWSEADLGMRKSSELSSVSMNWDDLHARSAEEHFVSTDGGNSWIRIGPGPPGAGMSLDYSISETHVFARSGDGEVWRRVKDPDEEHHQQ